MTPLRITLIGGKGGVGRMLVDAWRDEHELTVLDRSTLPLPGVREVTGEADDAEALTAALDGAEAVVLLAAHIPPGDELEKLPGTCAAISLNVGSVLLAMRLARNLGARSFVHLSSLDVFAQYSFTKVPAGAVPDATALYGMSKRLAEQALQVAVCDPAPAEETPPGAAPVPPGSADGAPFVATSLRLAYPTADWAWPGWVTSGRAEQPEPLYRRMDDGTLICAMHPTDLAAAVGADPHPRRDLRGHLRHLRAADHRRRRRCAAARLAPALDARRRRATRPPRPRRRGPRGPLSSAARVRRRERTAGSR